MMSTSPTVDVQAQGSQEALQPAGGSSRPFLICLPSMTSDAASSVLATLSRTFGGESLLVASPDQGVEQPASEGVPAIVPYPQPREGGDWVLNAADYAAAARLVADRGASAVLLLGVDAASLQPEALRAMQTALTAGADLALPRYQTNPDDALVNSALLYPVTRAIFATDVRFPLPIDAGLSARMVSRLADRAGRLGSQPEGGLIWPVAEAAIAGFSVRQVDGGVRALPQPQAADLNELFPAVTASLFSDVEAKATYWQRARPVPPARAPGLHTSTRTTPESADEVRSLVEGFRVAFNNLREIWSLVLPPQSLLALKKLSSTSPEDFYYPPSLWARTVYDFALAFHLRSLNRGHLLGALTPLYLAWVASFVRTSSGDTHAGTELLELTASAFEQEKAYLVSRWRWPDRFNP